MYCMRCGRELKTEGQAFCPECQEFMAQYPVAPGTPVQIPHRAATPAPKKDRRKHHDRKPEDQVTYLKFLLRWLTVLLVVMAAGFAFFAILLLMEL